MFKRLKPHMKNLLFLLALIPCALLAQTADYGDFKILNTEIIYQKVFTQDSITTEKMAKFLKTVPNVSNVNVAGDIITADLTDLTVDYKKFKFDQVAVPPIIQTGKYSGKLRVEGKPGKYRVILTSIQMKGDIGYKKIVNNENLTNYATTNSGTVISPNWCKPNTLGLLDKALTDRFTFLETPDSDW
jgi:hypothetical protein